MSILYRVYITLINPFVYDLLYAIYGEKRWTKYCFTVRSFLINLWNASNWNNIELSFEMIFVRSAKPFVAVVGSSNNVDNVDV